MAHTEDYETLQLLHSSDCLMCSVLYRGLMAVLRPCRSNLSDCRTFSIAYLFQCEEPVIVRA